MENTDIVCFGEVLWDQLGEDRLLGGAPLNVCYHLSRLGVSAKMVSQIGDDPDGKAMMQELQRLGLDTSHCSLSTTKPTSTVKVKLLEGGGIDYDIVEDVAWDHIEWTPALDRLVENSKILVYGSLATRSPATQKTLYTLLDKGKVNVFDVNLRSPFFTPHTTLSLMERADILKLNEDELKHIGGWLKGDQTDRTTAVQSIQEAFPRLGEIILTCGPQGACHIEKGIWSKVPSHCVRVIDTIGSGDSFLAAYIGSKIKGESSRIALEKASLLSAFIATHKGACPEYNWAEIAGLDWLDTIQ